MTKRRIRTAFGSLLVLTSAIAAPSCSAPPAEEDEYAPFPHSDARIEELATKLGRPSRFLIGHGNDLPGAAQNYDFTKAGIYTLPKKLDLHYVYLSGLAGEGGWPDDNAGGFVTVIANIAGENGVVPMFTLYQMAARGDGNLKGLKDVDFMTKYWKGVRLLFEELGRFGKPAIVHVEPDFWGYAQKQAGIGGAPALSVHVGALVPECASLSNDLVGFGHCIVRLGRALAPKAAIGFHASGFGAIGHPKLVASFLQSVGSDETDLIVLETLDRDAGCYEVGTDPECGRLEEAAYWDETNQTHPTFHDHLQWANAIHERTSMPILWWQMPLGVPSDKPGSPRAYRDNRVRYLFEHVTEFVQAGGIGAAFGKGGLNQTDITTDGGQLARYVSAYYASPAALKKSK